MQKTMTKWGAVGVARLLAWGVAALSMLLVTNVFGEDQGERKPEIQVEALGTCDRCPQYKFTIFTDGTTEYVGINNVFVKGAMQGRVSDNPSIHEQYDKAVDSGYVLNQTTESCGDKKHSCAKYSVVYAGNKPETIEFLFGCGGVNYFTISAIANYANVEQWVCNPRQQIGYSCDLRR